VSLSEEQIAGLSRLRTGSAVVMQNNWCEAVLSQINRYEYSYSGDITSVSGEKLIKFKSAVLGELLNEYAIKKTRSVARIMEVIEAFDIDAYKKDDARCMVKAVTHTLDTKWDSLYLGKAMMQYTGLDVVFKRAEQTMKDMPKKKKDAKDGEQSQFNVSELFNFLNAEVDRMIDVNDEQRRTIIQYMTYAKAYDETPIDYEQIYRTRYIR
jgi:hypothetical protein